MDEYESVLCVKNKVHVYKIPPRTSNRGYRAADWNRETPDWTGRLRVVSKARKLCIKLDDPTTGELFAQCPVDSFPGGAVEAVVDSSRFFVLRLEDSNGRHAFIGIGFEDRGDSFDLNVAIQDHFKYVKREVAETKAEAKLELEPGKKLDLGFKEGQTIRINIQTKMSGDGGEKSRARPKGSGAVGLLPPPPGPNTRTQQASNISPVSPVQPAAFPSATTNPVNPMANMQPSAPVMPTNPPNHSALDLLADLSPPPTLGAAPLVPPAAGAPPLVPQFSAPNTDNNDWGAFSSSNQSAVASNNSSGTSWVNFD